jgi:hypothetical protein
MACLSLNDQAFIFITMTFPSFVTTGGTVDIPTVPLERKALDLTPLIQQLMMNKKASSTGTTAKGDEKDPDIKGTTGQTEQWYDNYTKNQQEIKNLVNWFGTDVVTSQPEYRRLINEQNEITNPAVKQRLENNKQRLDAYDALVKEKGASGMINMDALSRYGIGMAHSDWSYFMQRGQTPEGLKVTRPGEFAWMEDFSFTSDIATFDDALKALNERYAGLGTSEFSTGGGSDQIYQDLKDDWTFLVSEHNNSVTTKKSNNNIYGENPRQIGQLEAVKQQALQSAFSGSFGKGMEGDDMANGLAGKFLSLTAETVPASKVGLPGNKSVKAIFQSKAYNDVFTDGQPNQGDYLDAKGNVKEAEYKKAVEDWNTKNQEAGKNYYKTHDGYYFKAGTKDENGNDIGGTLDQDALLGDYQRFIYDIVDAETNKRLTTVDSFKSDQTKTITATETWQQMANDAKAAEAAVLAANQEDFSVAVANNIGIEEDQFKKLLGGDLGDYSIVSELADFFTGKQSWSELVSDYKNESTRYTSDDDLNEMTYSSVSPFILNKDENGKTTYLPNPDFSGDKINIYKAAMKKHAIEEQNMSEDEAEAYAEEKTKKAKNAHKTLNDNYLTYGIQGMTSFDGTKATVVYQDEDLLKLINASWFDDIGGNKIGKTASQLFNNQLAQVGTTVVNGGQLFGGVFRFESIDEEHSFVNLGIASNAGAKAKYKMTINGKEYKQGAFIPLSVVDQMNAEQLKDFNSKVDYGTNGYWNIQNGMATTNGNPDKTKRVAGMGKNSEKVLFELNSTGGANAIAESGTSITSNVNLIGKKADIIAYWTTNGTTLTRQMPAYAQDDTKKVFWDEAEKLDRKYAIYGDDRPNAPKEKIELARKNVNELAKAAKIQIGSNAYKELEKTLYTTDYIERKNIIAKSLAIRNNVQGTANWDKSPKLVNETIVGIDGKVKDWAKSQLYLQEEKNSKGEELYRVTTAVEVQAQMAAANAEKTKQKIITHHNNRFKSASPPDKYSTNKAKANPKTE